MFQATCPSVCVLACVMVFLRTHVVLLEEAEVADDADPHQQGGGAQQDATHVVRRDALWRQHTRCYRDRAEGMDCIYTALF